MEVAELRLAQGRLREARRVVLQGAALLDAGLERYAATRSERAQQRLDKTLRRRAREKRRERASIVASGGIDLEVCAERENEQDKEGYLFVSRR